MPTVPNWIAKGYVYNWRSKMAFPVTHWRATKTQVVVTYDNGRTADREARFYLDTLIEVGGRNAGNLRGLLPSDDDRVRAALPGQAAAASVDRIRSMSLYPPLDASVESAAEWLGKVRDAATEALAELAEYL